MNQAKIIAEISSLVVASLAYVDVVGLLLTRHLTLEQRRELKRLCSGVHYQQALRPDGGPIICAINGKRVRMAAKVNLPQPSREVMEYLHALRFAQSPVDATLYRLEASLDWCTLTPADAVALSKVVTPLCWKRGRGSGSRVTLYAGGFTIGSAGRGLQLKVYWDRPSKVSGAPCVHIEWRFSSRRAVGEMGAENIEDLFNLAHGKFWKTRSPLHTLDYEALGKKLANRHLSTSAELVGKGTLKFNLDRVRGRTAVTQDTIRIQKPTMNHIVQALRRRDIFTTRILSPLPLPGNLLPFLIGFRRRAGASG